MTRVGRPVLLWLAALLLALSALAASAGHGIAPRTLAKPLASLPDKLGPWTARGADGMVDAASLKLLKPTSYLVRTYARPGFPAATVFIAFFAQQLEGAMIHSPRHCLPGAGWEIADRATVELATPQGSRPHKVNHFSMRHNLSRLSVLYWYQGRGRVEANEYRDRLHLVWDGAFQNRSDGALVRLTTGLPGGAAPEVETAQRELAAQVLAALKDILPPYGQGKE